MGEISITRFMVYVSEKFVVNLSYIKSLRYCIEQKKLSAKIRL